ncbi:MAG TPA: flagellar hook protein FlgE [Sandaracinaceae bacterium LLY-WYZ-13_1]|nr:flagellar hook protein FlgE [Sandaracinaceae bacterium LLY-WYZ-13_1]
MSIMRSLNTAASGIRSHSEALSVTGDNIANVNTVGFKRSRANFQDVLGRSIAGAGAMDQAGGGSQVGSIQQMWAQGALMTTDSPTDLALNGNGFFVVDGNVGGVQGQYYTRAGQFQIDAEGYMVSGDGLRLQGYPADATGSLSGTLGDLQVEGGTLSANATTEVDLAANLDSEAEVPPAWDPTDPEGTSNFSTTVTAYDSLGNAHEVTVYYRKSGANSWEWHAMADGGELTGGTAGEPTEGASGTLTFTTDGALDTETTTASSWDFVGATAGQTIEFDHGDSITTDGGTGQAGTTQYASPSSVIGLSQDGYGAGEVAGISIAQDGTITGVFTNGQRRTLGQVAVADFASVDGLERAGQGLWVETQESGEALVGAAGSGGRGAVVAGALEGSNVDLAREFVDLIAYQRGFSANSRIVTTADEMYTELVNLKR